MSSLRLLRLVFVTAVVTMVLALAGVAAPQPAQSRPKTLQAATYAQVRAYLQQYGGTGFDRVLSTGSLAAFRRALASVTIEVDRSLGPLGRYDPATRTITLKRDPRAIPASGPSDFAETVWHEMSHAIEHAHGDFGIADSVNYAERNVEFMATVINDAGPVLRNLEKLARDGASTERLARQWQAFLRRMDAAHNLDSTSAYPVDASVLAAWFGFRADPEQIKAFYLSGSFLPGRAGAKLRAALGGQPGPAPATPSWSGTWSTDWGAMVLTQTGNSVSGTYTHDSGRIVGTVNGLELTGRWSELPTYAGPSDAGTVVLTMSPDGRSFTGRWTYDGGGGGTWSGTR